MRLRDPGLIYLKTDLLMDPLRQEPRFQAVMGKVEVADGLSGKAKPARYPENRAVRSSGRFLAGLRRRMRRNGERKETSITQTGHFGVHLRRDLSGIGVGHRVRL